MALSLGLAPAFATDALAYHLAIPKAFLEAEGIINLPNNIYSFYPQHMEMLYLFALALGSDHLAQLVGLGICLLLLIALHQNFSQKGSSEYSFLAPAIFLSTPAFFEVTYSSYVDVQTTAYIFFAFYAWENWCSRKQKGWLFLMIIFIGTALATQLTAIIAIPMAVLAIAIHDKNHLQKFLQHCIMLTLGVLFLTSPWWGRNYLITGNPFTPFFMQFFGGEQGINWDATRSIQYFKHLSSYGVGHGVLDFLMLPINLTFFGQPHSFKFNGQIGILYLLLIPALIGLRKQSLPMGITFFIFLTFWFTQTQQARFLSTPFAFLSILSTQGLEGWLTHKSKRVGEKEKTFLFTIILTGLLFNSSLIAKSWVKINPLPYILQKETRDPFLMRQIRSYPVYLSANHIVEENEKVMLVYMQNLGFLMHKPFYSDSIFEYHTIKNIIDEEVYAEDIIIRLKAMGITHILFNYNLIFGKNSTFTPGEKGIFKNFLLRHAQRVSAKNEFLLYRFMLD